METQAVSSSMGAMGSLLAKIHSLLDSPEDQLPKQLKQLEQVELLKQDLEETNTLLADLSRVEAPNTLANHWMNEVRDLSYGIEDYIDNMQSNSYTDEEMPSKIEEFSTLVEQASDARKRYERYGLGRWASNPSCLVPGGPGPVPTPSLETRDLVGIGDSKGKLIKWLTNLDEKQRKVVSILGPGGVGKTTLAREVYREIGGQFECRAFVRASRMPDTRRLLRSMISQIQRHQRPLYAYTVQDLIDRLFELLQQKRYFIVVDGLWETTSWDIVADALPEGTHCSRILITTDIDEVALECCGYQPDASFNLEPLSRNYSTELFFSGILFNLKHECSEELKQVSEKVIRNCCGVPLAIISIASILASQPDNIKFWHHVEECLSYIVKNNFASGDILREIVCLCYNNLSHHLKTCLLYLSMYPEGYTFLKADLVKQWTAEGFISMVAEKDAHQVAETLSKNEISECYFNELVCRGFIQPNQMKVSDEVMFYTVHSTVFEVIKYKSEEQNFTTVIDYSDTTTELPARIRRLSLYFSNAKYATKPEGITLSLVRSLIFYGLIECMPSIVKFEALRVLILEIWGDKKELDLSGISRLFQLRYVQIKTDIIVKLPAKLKGLEYLETLEIYARITTVPSDIVDLPSLLHLCLRTLQCADLSSNSQDNVQSLGKMTNLHNLHLACSTELSDHLQGNLIALASFVGKNVNLKSLSLALGGSSCTTIYMDCSSSVSSPPIFLERLELLPPICIFSRLPEWIGQLRKLRILKIFVRELTTDDVNRIDGLHELTVLSLYVRQPTAESIIFNRKAFSVLKYFKFRCGILRLAFQAEAMPNLRRLKLEFNAHSGEDYGNMLAGIEHLLNLQEIAGRIGAAPGAEESDRMAAESMLRGAISKHSRLLSFNARQVNSVDEETSYISDPPTSSSRATDSAFMAGGGGGGGAGGGISGTSSLWMTNDDDASSTTTEDMFTNDDDSSSTTTEGMFIISPNGKFKLKIKSWMRGALLGSGSFGLVYEGISDEGAFFAVKEVSLLDQGSNAQQSILALEQEIAFLSQFEHENIVQYYGTDTEESKLYIFIELATQGSLSSLYQKYKLRESQVSEYTRQILNGLLYLHEQYVVHRDIKCANILVHASGSVKLADFGLAQEMSKINMLRSCKGSIYWMAPEVVNPKKMYGPSADIWSLGCTVLEMLTGQLPFPNVEWTNAFFMIGRGEQPPIPNYLSKEAQDFIGQCVRVDPETRPSASQLLEHPFVNRPL